ncbi:MAG: DUF4395 domain-containing protein [Pseudomonadota bacterium]
MTDYVDHAEIKMGQLLTIVLSIAALVLQNTLPMILLGVVFFLSGSIRVLSPFTWLYHGVVRPLRLMRSDYRLDNIQPHKFGQLIGALTVVLAVGLVEVGYTTAGWAVVVVLVLLTAMSYAGWCIGCFLYYRINRLGLGGFFRHAPTDRSVFPGRRPRRSATESGNISKEG